jgi:hypothetical protein
VVHAELAHVAERHRLAGWLFVKCHLLSRGSSGSPRMDMRRRLGQGMDPRIGHAVCLGQQPGVLYTLLVAVEAATCSAGPRAPGMLDVGFTRRGRATKTSDDGQSAHAKFAHVAKRHRRAVRLRRFGHARTLSASTAARYILSQHPGRSRAT